MIRLLIIISVLFFSFPCISQEKEVNADLLFYGDVMTYAFEGENRVRAANEFSALLEKYLESDPMLEQEQGFKKYLSILELEDDLKLVSWRAKTMDHSYKYGCYLLENGKQPQVFNRTEPLSQDMALMTSSSQDWYGCYYYNFQKLSKNQYVILGYDPTSEFDNQKIADILTIDNGSILLGAPVFEDKESMGTFINRLIISFSSDASVSFNFDPDLDILLQDHLEPRLGLQAGQGATNLPDGTYEGYKEKGGKWMYVEKIFDHVYETAPVPKPTDKGLFKNK